MSDHDIGMVGGGSPGPVERPARASRVTGVLLGRNEKMREVQDLIARVADTDVTVLIRGESGTGKELVARAIHSASPRRDKSFVKVNCAALPSELLESELFGFERGAFTGAIQHKPGKFEFANHGTMFLDEISEMQPPLQSKLLQVLQDGEFARLGGRNDVRVDVRIVAATNRDLEVAVADGQFREDLFFRLNVVCITLPPLRQRRDEIPELTRLFLRAVLRALQQAAAGAGVRHAAAVRGIRVAGQRARAGEPDQAHGDSRVRRLDPPRARRRDRRPDAAIRAHSRAAVAPEPGGASRRGRARRAGAARDAGAGAPAAELPPAPTGSLKDIARHAAREAERELIYRTLQQTRWNRREAAEILGISYKALLYKIKEAELDKAS